MLNLIGIGLNDEKDITVKGLDLVKNSDLILLENYTSLLQCSVQDLEKFYDKKIELANRERIENDCEKLVEQAKTKNVTILVIGDALSATTHVEYILECKKQNVNFNIVHNASIFTAIAITGLQLYKFGKTASIPFHEADSYWNIYQENQKINAHTLFLLDLQDEKFMTGHEAIKKLIKKGLDPLTKAVIVERLGSSNAQVHCDTARNLLTTDLGPAPHSLIIPGKLHFKEEEALEQ
ncbi:diphthine synthase [Candidatus Woesearchaeota archaeon CG10_big_fil_rev_8_21_14_0_10_30_7]|nr:MAG: diphthine synthase [Candidatus Woesearchaeota archaeon CG10_big_fil_rev_8_21_14_0_10_30_7]